MDVSFIISRSGLKLKEHIKQMQLYELHLFKKRNDFSKMNMKKSIDSINQSVSSFDCFDDLPDTEWLSQHAVVAIVGQLSSLSIC